MKALSKPQAITAINALASTKEPFLFISDFKGQRNHVLDSVQLKESPIKFSVNGFSNSSSDLNGEFVKIEKTPIPFTSYKTYYEKVHHELKTGNSYLLNLTFPTKITSEHSLEEIYTTSHARYKLLFGDQFVVFSPEIFVQIEDGMISSYPMKGTIDADLLNAREIILASDKEMAEHATIVDLIRNDMSIHAKDVKVEKFRYIDEVRTSHKHLLQVSSKITGRLEDGYEKRLGDVLFSLLPAGSICGAPKPKTLDIIGEVEDYDRGYYTGVFGYYDGKRLDSGVMIRYIEKQGPDMVYKSGGGIHYLSNAESEYQEMIDKVYVPIR